MYPDSFRVVVRLVPNTGEQSGYARGVRYNVIRGITYEYILWEALRCVKSLAGVKLHVVGFEELFARQNREHPSRLIAISKARMAITHT